MYVVLYMKYTRIMCCLMCFAYELLCVVCVSISCAYFCQSYITYAERVAYGVFSVQHFRSLCDTDWLRC